MKLPYISKGALRSALVLLAGLSLAISPASAQNDKEDLSNVGNAVVRLLETGDATKFADEMSATVDDWRATVSSDTLAKTPDALGPNFQKGRERERSQMEMNAKSFLEKTKSLGLDSSHVKFQLKKTSAKGSGRYQNFLDPSEDAGLAWTPEVEILLRGVPVKEGAETAKFAGDYAVSLGGMNGVLKFPAGWRSSGSLRWKSLPPGIAGKDMELELSLLEKINKDHQLTLKDDPALAATGNGLARFLKSHDERVYASEALQSMDEIWASFEKQSAGRSLPPRAEFEKRFAEFQKENIESARKALDELDKLGIKLSDANVQLKEGVAERIYPRGAGDDIDGGPLRFTFTVQSDQKTADGKSISGDYVLTAGRAKRGEKRWSIEDKLRWERLPDALLSKEAKAALEFENYVAEHGSLPPGTLAPEIELIALKDGSKLKLADKRGKVVILEFWATWCGPCQEPMAKLQTVREHHPEWKDKVEIISASIDDTAEEALKHLEKLGWTNTVSTWVGTGDWKAKPTTAFRVRGVPTMYVIGADGKIVTAGHPMGLQYAEAVEGLLK